MNYLRQKQIDVQRILMISKPTFKWSSHDFCAILPLECVTCVLFIVMTKHITSVHTLCSSNFKVISKGQI